MAKKYVTLEEVVSEWLSDAERKLTTVTCWYNKHTGGRDEVQSLRLEGKTWSAETIANTLQGKAETHVQDSGGMHRFTVEAFYDGKGTAQSSHSFTVIDGEVHAGGSARTVHEQPTSTGLTAQSMKHTQEAWTLVRQSTEGALVRADQRESRHMERIQKLEAELNDAYVIIREMIFKDNQAQHQMRMEQLRYERDTSMQLAIVKNLPALANGLSGKEIFPQNLVDSTIMRKVAEKASDEMIQMMIGGLGLKQEESAPIILRLTQIREEILKEQEAVKNMPSEEHNLENGASIVKAATA